LGGSGLISYQEPDSVCRTLQRAFFPLTAEEKELAKQIDANYVWSLRKERILKAGYLETFPL